MTGQDTYRHKGLRRRLIDELRELNIADARTLEAMLEVPRHLFFPDQAFVEKAYEDIAFKIVNREWDMTEKSGFKNVFDRGILYLYFNFKRYRYKR